MRHPAFKVDAIFLLTIFRFPLPYPSCVNFDLLVLSSSMAMQTRRAKERRQLVKSYLLALYPETEGDDNAMDEYRLKSYEFFWRDHYLWLEEKGYRLRPRYHPDWVASWKDTGESWVDCEDGQISTVSGFSTSL